MPATMTYVSLYLTSPGALGFRAYLTLREGRKWTWLLALEDATNIRTTTTEYTTALNKGRGMIDLTPAAAARIAIRLKRTAGIYRREDSRAVRFALARLRIITRDTPAPSTTQH